MIPAQYLAPSLAEAILDTLGEGSSTVASSDNTYVSNPSLAGGLITSALATLFRNTDLSGATSTFSTGTLTATEIETLTGIRSRVIAAIGSAYADLPKQNPLNDHNTGLPLAQANQDHQVDIIIQTIYKWDPRYFLRIRSNVGANAQNDAYELPSRYNYITNPMVVATMRLHGFTSNVANIGPTLARVTSSVPHGYYSGMTIKDTATASATTWTANVTTNDTTSLASVDTYFTANAVPTFVTGNDINIAVPSTANSAYFWSALNDLGSAYVDVTGNNIRFYRDVARTDQIKASWGNIASTGWQATDTVNERVAVNTDGQHLIIPTAPLQFNYTSGNAQPSIYELKYISSYNPVTQTFTSNVAGFSIYDGQLVNMAQTGSSTIFANPIADSRPHYFKRVSNTTYQIYQTADLAAGNIWAFGNTSTISNIAYDAGNSVWQVNYNSTIEYPRLLGGQDIRFVNTTGATNFSAAVNITQNSAAGNIQIYATAGFFSTAATGTVSGRPRLVAAKIGSGATVSIVYSDDGQRWNTATSGPTDGVYKIRWVPSLNKFFAITTSATNRIWTSSNGISWTDAHAGHPSAGGQTYITSADLGTQTAIYVIPATLGNDVTPNDPVIYYYNNSTGNYASSSTYSVDRPTGDTWLVRDVAEQYMLAQNNSTGELRIFGNLIGPTTYAVAAGVIISLANGALSRMETNSTTMVVTTHNTVYRVAKSNLAAGWRTSGAAWTTGARLIRVSDTELHGFGISDNRNFWITGGSFGAYTTLPQYTVSAVATPVMCLGYIENRYAFANMANTGATEGYYTEDISAAALEYSYNDRYTATAHPFTTGQQIRPSATWNFNGTIVTPPENLWIEVYDANSFDLFQNEERTIAYNSGRPSGVMTASTVTPVFYVKRRSARTWDLYLGSDITDTNNRFSDNTKMTGGTTTGSTVWNGYKTSIVDDADVFIRPMFYPQYHSSTRVSLWVDLAKTQPYAYFGRNGTRLNQQTGYVTTGLYFLNNIGHALAVGNDNLIPNVVIGINTTPQYYAKVINDYVIDLYTDSALTTPYTQVSWSNSAATLWQVNSSQYAPWRLDNIYVPNIGTKTYFTTNLTTSTTTVNATWALTGRKYYTSYDETQTIAVNPAVNVAEHQFANAGAAYGGLRYADTTGSGGPGNVLVVSGTTYGGFGAGPTPVYYDLNAPGRFVTNGDFIFGIAAEPNSGTAPAVDTALASTGNAWATASNLTSVDERRWPSTIAPSSVTWTIEQPNSTLESYNLTRYSRARDVTQYRIRLTYPPMTKAQIGEFTQVIHAARGSFKPMVFTPPFNSVTQQYVTIKVGEKNVQVPAVFRARVDNASGQQILQVDGLPPSLGAGDPAFSGGWAVELPIRNSTGSWGIPIHDVLTNAYGEANMRLNNNIASAIDFGAEIGADAADLDVFIDADSVELKVDTAGFHYLEIDLVTKRIF